MRPNEPAGTSRETAARPRWSEVLRALREARGVTLAGWGARLGVSRTTVQRWERGERVPDPGAESAILAYCREADLFRTYDTGPLAGLGLTEDALRDLLAEARWRLNARPVDGGQSGSPAHPRRRVRRCPVDRGRVPRISVAAHELRRPRARDRGSAAGAGRHTPADPHRRRRVRQDAPGARAGPRAALGILAWHLDCGARRAGGPGAGPETVATALGLHPTGARPTAEEVSEFLDGRHLLLVLDNCEHLLTTCAPFAEALLRASPTLEVIATSREPLGIAGETIWRVPPMAEPDSLSLFVDRARLHRPEFELTPANADAVAEVCRRLDGIPLAIELATARLKMLAPEQIAARLGDRLGLLTGGSRTALPRHQTLRAALDWSYDLLTEPEQALLCGLAVFAGRLHAGRGGGAGRGTARTRGSPAGAQLGPCRGRLRHAQPTRRQVAGGLGGARRRRAMSHARNRSAVRRRTPRAAR